MGCRVGNTLNQLMKGLEALGDFALESKCLFKLVIIWYTDWLKKVYKNCHVTHTFHLSEWVTTAVDWSVCKSDKCIYYLKD